MADEPLGIHPEGAELPKAVEALLSRIRKEDGRPLAVYRDPIGEHWQVFALLPMARVAPTPYQRDVSKPHADRLRDVIRKLDRFVDPIVAVPAPGGGYWTPNGNHRRTALEKLKADLVPAIVIPDAEIAFRILALNTERAHNLREKSLEVIRMYRGLVESDPSRSEDACELEFEEPHFATLGVLYEANGRFAGGAFAPILRRVDKFLKSPLRKSIAEREERGARVRAASEALDDVVKRLKKRGITHPYVKNFVLARTSPLTRARKTVPSFEQTFERLATALEKFDTEKVHFGEIARAAAFAAPASSA
jgi:ParB family chromosome partitioning protein